MEKEQTNTMPSAFKNKWVQALRSGRYTQGFNCGSSKENCTDAIGVAYRIAGVSRKAAIKDRESGSHKNIRFLPSILRGNSSPLVQKLISFNDEKQLSFNWIAAYIERNL